MTLQMTKLSPLPLHALAAALCAALLALSGCASIPLEHDVLPQQDLARAELAAGIKLASEGWPAAQWWTQYHDAQLDALIKQALAGAPDLAVAGARIGSAQSALAADRADLGINTALAVSANRQRYSGNGLFPEPIGGNYFTSETVQLQAHYEADWWGKHKAQIASTMGEVNARRADYAMAEQLLAAQVAQRYFSLQGNWARLGNLRQWTGLQQALLADQAKLIARGLATIDVQHTVQAQISALRQQSAYLEAQTVREREALRALLGFDNTALADLHPSGTPNLPHALPAHLGIELLARRADLQAARWRVQASLSRIEASKAAFYPDIDLSASFGLDAIKLGKLLQSGSRTLFVGPALSMPLFDSKRLEAQLDGARQRRNELIADYNQTVFDVVRDVAQSGADVQGLENQLRQQDGVRQAKQALLDTAQKRMRQGLATRGAALNAESAVLQQRDTELQLQNQQLLAEISLVRALGGGYRDDTRNDTLASSTHIKQ